MKKPTGTARPRAAARPRSETGGRALLAASPKERAAGRSAAAAAKTVRARKPAARNSSLRVAPSADPGRIARALISVYDKEGIVDFARALDSAGVEIVSTGGTARFLVDNGIAVVRVAGYTGFPEMLDGRVKTLHPKIHAGIMAVRDNPSHMRDLERAGIKVIDLVVCNLYPFEKTAAMDGIGFDEIVEMIDIGGPTMLRAGAKNFHSVGVIVDPADYRRAIDEIRERGSLSEIYRFDLAKKAFAHVAAYDMAICSYLSRLRPDGTLSPEAQRSGWPEKLHLDLQKLQDLRYGENPHQSASFYREPTSGGPSIASALKLQGKDLSFNNILDLDAALALVAEFDSPVCAIVKHNTPCGVALGAGAKEAYERAFETDPLSAFGGVIGFNIPVDEDAASAVSAQFAEAIVAPSFTPAALEILAAKKHLRLLETGRLEDYRKSGYDLRRVNGGLLVQEWDLDEAGPPEIRVVTRRAPTPEETSAMRFAVRVVKHVRSNAIVYALKDRTLGIGAGQMSRLDSARFGAMKARQSLEGSVVASDAFFPFRDGIDEIASHGATAIIQPGGSIRDAETIAAADEHDVAMVFTGYRHFRH